MFVTSSLYVFAYVQSLGNLNCHEKQDTVNDNALA